MDEIELRQHVDNLDFTDESLKLELLHVYLIGLEAKQEKRAEKLRQKAKKKCAHGKTAQAAATGRHADHKSGNGWFAVDTESLRKISSYWRGSSGLLGLEAEGLIERQRSETGGISCSNTRHKAGRIRIRKSFADILWPPREGGNLSCSGLSSDSVPSVLLQNTNIKFNHNNYGDSHDLSPVSCTINFSLLKLFGSFCRSRGVTGNQLSAVQAFFRCLKECCLPLWLSRLVSRALRSFVPGADVFKCPYLQALGFSSRRIIDPYGREHTELTRCPKAKRDAILSEKGLALADVSCAHPKMLLKLFGGQEDRLKLQQLLGGGGDLYCELYCSIFHVDPDVDQRANFKRDLNAAINGGCKPSHKEALAAFVQMFPSLEVPIRKGKKDGGYAAVGGMLQTMESWLMEWLRKNLGGIRLHDALVLEQGKLEEFERLVSDFLDLKSALDPYARGCIERLLVPVTFPQSIEVQIPSPASESGFTFRQTARFTSLPSSRVPILGHNHAPGPPYPERCSASKCKESLTYHPETPRTYAKKAF